MEAYYKLVKDNPNIDISCIVEGCSGLTEYYDCIQIEGKSYLVWRCEECGDLSKSPVE